LPEEVRIDPIDSLEVVLDLLEVVVALAKAGMYLPLI
jgi:hypothetical protein